MCCSCFIYWCGCAAGFTALWYDEFDGGSLDKSKWGYDLGNGNWGWGNNEVQFYTDREDNARVSV
jgi:hypothetical protein